MPLGAPPRASVFLFALALVACSDSDGRRSVGRDAAPAAPARTDPAPESVGGIAAVRTDVGGVVADLLTAERADGRLTVAIRFRNTAGRGRRVEIPDDYESGWRLEAGGRDWPLATEPDGDPLANEPPRRVLEPAQSALWRGTFVAPPRDVKTFRLEVPGVRPFEDVPIIDAGGT
ncbi:MAG: hypothetical protein R3326_08220 [Gemmatimonadota bacterium]|nr:hypothetical protein [Gemmatimonadota bacterium]